ncbi:DUF2806 domain-containing protein [Klebsiella pneumoniae]|uniref:DUF2806 domain-containing protein n=1 Tax=Klebsiella pneumoniae TaxID=573 RepID=UPI00226E281B|nr:DUF2806 domain-containing protein [Klebsiella pneumoniae]MCX9939052.1 DUF2806 domain-containing protein [Klebsiella pneumoniae]MCY0259828.1 DUF2806 domain-containing protein [Klebsiella pneumoniae]
MDKGIDVNVNAELKADLQPVIEKTPSALNKLFELCFGVKHAKQKRFIELINAQSERDLTSIENGLAIFDIEQKIIVPNTTDDSKTETSLIQNKVNSDEVSNISKCAKQAALNLLDAELPDDKEITQDFFNRWRNEAKMIHESSAQLVWGLILAEEIQHPESISLRALDVLRNLTKHEANLFDEMGKYIVYGSALLKGKHINDNELRRLADAGLLNFAGIYSSSAWLLSNLTYNDNVKIEVPYIRCCDYFIHAEPSDDKFSFSFIPLTDAGQAIYRISKNNNTWDVTDAIKTLLEDKNSPTKLTYYKYTNLAKGFVDLDNPFYYSKSDDAENA